MFGLYRVILGQYCCCIGIMENKTETAIYGLGLGFRVKVWGYIGVILRLYWDYVEVILILGLYWGYIKVLWRLYWGYLGV